MNRRIPIQMIHWGIPPPSSLLMGHLAIDLVSLSDNLPTGIYHSEQASETIRYLVQILI